MKDIKALIESVAVAWATLAIIPGMDVIDFPVIILLKNILGASYIQVAVVYYGIAIFVLYKLAPKKFKKLYNQIRRYF